MLQRITSLNSFKFAMPKKLILIVMTASVFALTAHAKDQANPTLLASAPSQPADESIVELETITVTADVKAQPFNSARPMIKLSGDDLTMKLGNTIGDALKQELGITSQTFGPGVGTPVIRGQSGPRVRVLQNGIGSNDLSQLSPDHATSIDPSLAESIEVLRGPATLLYSSGATGGVVNVIDNRIPTHLSAKPVNLVFDQRYDSAYSESSTALKA